MRFSRRSAVLLAVPVAVFALGWLAFKSFATVDKPDYTTAVVQRGDLEIVVAAAGKLKAFETLDVGAQVSGQLTKLHVEAGDTVEAGELLAEIDPTLAEARVDQDRASLKELQASLASQRATIELSRLNAKRSTMLKEADAISEADNDAALTELAVSEARAVQLEAQIERAQSNLNANVANLEYTKIFAPMSGTVTKILAKEGQTLNANQTAPVILQIADLNTMTVEADVSEADVLRLKTGQAATFTIFGAERVWKSQVRQVLPTPEILNDVVLYKALLDVENTDGMLRPEMTAQVKFIEGQAQNAVLVPIAAIRQGARQGGEDAGRRRDAGEASDNDTDEAVGNRRRAGPSAEFLKAHPDAERAMVLVETDEGIQRQPIFVGLKDRSMAEVLTGLKQGDTVIIGETSGQESRRQPSSDDNGGFRRTPGGRRGGRG